MAAAGPDRSDTPTPGVGRAGLAFALVKFGLIFVVGAMLWVALDPAFQELVTAQDAHTSTQAATTGYDWIEQAWNWMPFFVAMLAFIMLVARAFVERQLGGGVR